jgi:hypothetical protein
MRPRKLNFFAYLTKNTLKIYANVLPGRFRKGSQPSGLWRVPAPAAGWGPMSLPGGGIHRGSRPSGLWRVPAATAGREPTWRRYS